jgi:hypothetical protein
MFVYVKFQMYVYLILFSLFVVHADVHHHHHVNDLFKLEELFKSKYNRHGTRIDSADLLDLLRSNQDASRSSDENNDEQDSNTILDELTTRKVPLISESLSTCIDQYETKSEQLVKVKYLHDNAFMIRFVSIDPPSVASTLSLKEICLAKCCSEPNCDLAMLSEQHTHVS